MDRIDRNPSECLSQMLGLLHTKRREIAPGVAVGICVELPMTHKIEVANRHPESPIQSPSMIPRDSNLYLRFTPLSRLIVSNVRRFGDQEKLYRRTIDGGEIGFMMLVLSCQS